MRTYERVFQHVNPSSIKNGHALDNIENERTLRIALAETTKMQKEMKK